MKLFRKISVSIKCVFNWIFIGSSGCRLRIQKWNIPWKKEHTHRNTGEETSLTSVNESANECIYTFYSSTKIHLLLLYTLPGNMFEIQLNHEFVRCTMEIPSRVKCECECEYECKCDGMFNTFQWVFTVCAHENWCKRILISIIKSP